MPVPLRIGVDARPLSIPQTGIGRYTEEVLRRMLSSEHDWYLYSDRPLMQRLPPSDKLSIRNGHSSHRIAGTLFPQVAYPYWARRDQLDVFWTPRHHLPLALSARIRKVVTVHDLVGFLAPTTMTATGRRLETWLTPRSIQQADAVIVDARSTRKDLDRVLGYGAEKAHVIPLAATGNSRSGLMPRPVSNPYYLFVGTLEPRKNLPRLLQAFAAIKHRDPELKLVLAGDAGWGEQKLEQRIAELSIEDSVVLTGRLDETSLHCYYRHALALVLPSLYEGFGLPLLEAMQYGVPVITSNCSSMPEVAGDAGLLVDPEDVGSIATALIDMLENIPLRKRLAAAAAQQAIRFNWDTSAAKTLAVLEGSSEQAPKA